MPTVRVMFQFAVVADVVDVADAGVAIRSRRWRSMTETAVETTDNITTKAGRDAMTRQMGQPKPQTATAPHDTSPWFATHPPPIDANSYTEHTQVNIHPSVIHTQSVATS